MRKSVYRLSRLVSGSVAIVLLWPISATGNVKIEAKGGEKKSASWIIAQSPPQESNNQNQEVLFPNPTILIDGKPVNGTAPQPVAPPPFLPRAVAPPVGDMAVSNVNTLPPRIDLGTNARVPRLVLRNAPAPEVLALLARAAGLNVIFTEGEKEAAAKTITLELDDEPIQDIFNNVLLMSGLTASRQGNTIFIGKTLPPTVKNSIARTIRLNQYSAIGAATFLNSQGAQGNIIEVKETQEEQGRIKQTFQLKPLPSTEKENEYLILKGLTVHADPVNNSITLVGEPYLVQTATSFLTQLDVRRRQVAVNVKVVDVGLGQNDSFGSSFSFGIDDTGVIQDGGVGVINFGTNSGNVPPELAPPGATDRGRITPFGTTFDPNNPRGRAGVQEALSFNLPQAFLAQIRASIQSGNAKVLTDPTLVVQEGQTGTVKLVENVVTSVKTEIDPESGVRTVTPVLEPAGLTLSVIVERVDDNGFITLQVNPTVSAPGQPQRFSSGGGAENTITPLIERTVSSGRIRVRDGQTLILTGIIQEDERNTVSKIPILGDLPIIGSLFRSSTKQKNRSEVVVVITPRILDDSEPYSATGYNYTPGRETGRFLRERGINLPTSP